MMVPVNRWVSWSTAPRERRRSRTEALIQRGMDALMEDRTVFVIAHRLSTVRNSNCIVVIEHGEIEEKGSVDRHVRRLRRDGGEGGLPRAGRKVPHGGGHSWISTLRSRAR